MTVLSGLRSGHVDDLAGTPFDHNETVLAESGALHRVRGGGASIGALEGVLMLNEVMVSEVLADAGDAEGRRE